MLELPETNRIERLLSAPIELFTAFFLSDPRFLNIVPGSKGESESFFSPGFIYQVEGAGDWLFGDDDADDVVVEDEEPQPDDPLTPTDLPGVQSNAEYNLNRQLSDCYNLVAERERQINQLLDELDDCRQRLTDCQTQLKIADSMIATWKNTAQKRKEDCDKRLKECKDTIEFLSGQVRELRIQLNSCDCAHPQTSSSRVQTRRS